MVVMPPVATTQTTPPPAPKPATAMTITPSTTQVTRNAEGTATITNTASASARPASNDATRAHYDEMAKSFAAQPATGAFTIQFELVCETASLTKAIRDGGSSVWFTPISYRNRSCYRVFWGHYPTKDEATRAAREVPLALRGGASPAVVKVPTS
jgi:septal ring-binding cell division protein DamX